jgi:hypothetical protein
MDEMTITVKEYEHQLIETIAIELYGRAMKATEKDGAITWHLPNAVFLMECAQQLAKEIVKNRFGEAKTDEV